MKIALGSASPQKKQYVELVLSSLAIKADVYAFDVTSGVSSQPLADIETKTGSINRARNALRLLANADFALGIEVGYQPDPSAGFEMFCWTTLVNQSDRLISARSQTLPLPGFHQQVLRQGNYLGEHVRQYLEQNQDLFSQKIGVVIRDRQPFIVSSVESVLLAYLAA